MKKIGFFGVAEATTLSGEVTLTPAVGFETVSGKSFDPLPQSEVPGSCAVGAGSRLLVGDQVIDTGGVDGYEGWVGVVGEVGVVMLEGALHATSERLKSMRREIPQNRISQNQLPPTAAMTARIHQASNTGLPTLKSRSGSGKLPESQYGQALTMAEGDFAGNTAATLRSNSFSLYRCWLENPI
jgi:hypothetical protein